MSYRNNFPNLFRTLLLNLPPVLDGTEPLISKEFSPQILPKELADFHKLLFPASLNRHEKLVRVAVFLQLLKGAGLWNVQKIHSPVLTYTSEDLDALFKISRISEVFSSAPNFPLFVTGGLKKKTVNGKRTRTFEIAQTGNTPEVCVFDFETGVLLTAADMSFTADVSNVVNIPDTDLSFSLGKMSGESFTATGGKVWRFSAETPEYFDLQDFFEELARFPGATAGMLSAPVYSEDSRWDNLSQNQSNQILAFAGLLVAFYCRLYWNWREGK